jgi:hypothetical protein
LFASVGLALLGTYGAGLALRPLAVDIIMGFEAGLAVVGVGVLGFPRFKIINLDTEGVPGIGEEVTDG